MTDPALPPVESRCPDAGCDALFTSAVTLPLPIRTRTFCLCSNGISLNEGVGAPCHARNVARLGPSTAPEQ